MKYLISGIALLVINLSNGFSQDSTQNKISYYSVNSFGFELNNFYNDQNYFYLQSLHGVKFDQNFGISAGPTLIYYEQRSFLPLVVSIRRSPTKAHKFGYNFDIGYNLPLSGTGEEFQLDYEMNKGGSYFHPQINGLIYDNGFAIYMNMGFRVYTYSEKYYTNGFGVGAPRIEYEDRITTRLITVGITVEI